MDMTEYHVEAAVKAERERIIEAIGADISVLEDPETAAECARDLKEWGVTPETAHFMFMLMTKYLRRATSHVRGEA